MIHVKLRFRRIKVSCCSSYLCVCDRRKKTLGKPQLKYFSLDYGQEYYYGTTQLFRRDRSEDVKSSLPSSLHLRPSAPSDHEHQRCEPYRQITLMLNTSCLEISFNKIFKSYTSSLNVRLFSYLSSTISLFAIILNFI